MLAIDKISANIKLPTQISLLADGQARYLKGTSIDATRKLLQAALNELESQSKQSGLKFSPTKTEVILFHNKKQR